MGMTRGARVAPTRRRRSRWRPLANPLAYAFVAPALLIFLVFTILPTLYTFGISTFRWNWLNPDLNEFVGAENYADMVTGARDPNFWSTMATSLYFTAALVIGGTALSLALALLLREATKISYAVRTTMFLCHVTPLVATSIVWVWIFNPRFGLANLLLTGVGGPQLSWLGSERTAMLAVIIFSLWHELGFLVLIFLGGLTTLSKDLSEAARLDGAGWWSEFWHITLPQLRPFIVFVVVITSVASLQAFTQFFVMTGGGPGFATTTLGFSVYQAAFVFRKTGYAAALAVVLFVITVALSAAQLATSRGLGRSRKGNR